MHVQIPELRGEIAVLNRTQRLILEEQHVMSMERIEDLVPLRIADSRAQVNPRNLRANCCGDGLDDHVFTIPAGARRYGATTR